MMYLIASDFNDDLKTRTASSDGLLGIIFIYVALNFGYFAVQVTKVLAMRLKGLIKRIRKVFAKNTISQEVIKVKPITFFEGTTFESANNTSIFELKGESTSLGEC